jgi:hypothetical protein
MKIQFMKDDSVYALKKYIKYAKNHYTDVDIEWIKNITNNDENFGLFKKEFNDFDLVISDKPEKDDIENMKIIYDNLKDLTDSQASDERLWAGLSHTKFWNYMQKRWPLPNDPVKWEKHILQHYFFAHGARSTVLNGLARLWWYARLTYDETNIDNPYELTEYMAKDINGKAYMLFGSNFSRNREIQRIFLYTIKNYEEQHGLILSREEFGELRKQIVLWSGKLVIDIVDRETLKNKLTKEIERLISKR